jgi:hypothetical protein
VVTLLTRIACLLVLAWSLFACGDATGTLVVGVTSDYRAGTDLAQLDVVMQVDGEVLSQQSLALGTSSGKTSFPAEFSFDGVSEGSTLTLTLRGFDIDGVLRVARHLETTAIGDATNLVRIHLESECMLRSDAEAQLISLPSAPTCNESTETCIAGACGSANVPAGDQEPYRDDWPQAFGDICKPEDAGAAEVIVGKGQSDYLAAVDYELAQVEAGPQGGHHIWIAARIKNLRRSGSITSVGGEIPALMVSVTPLKVIFTFDPDEGDYCMVYGLRFQLDIDGAEIETLLGAEVKVMVEVTDSDGDSASGERWFTLSDDIL